MKSKSVVAGLIGITGWFFTMTVQAETIQESLQAKEKVIISTVSGNCVIKTAKKDKIEVTVVAEIDPKDAFEPRFEERSGYIRLSERWRGNSSGEVNWTIVVPAETEIEYKTASGDLHVSGLNQTLEGSSASGDIEVENCSGELDISCASGDITILNFKGELDLSTASGDIRVENAQGEFKISTASGNIEVNTSSGEFDISTASGDADFTKITLNADSEFSTASGNIVLLLTKSTENDLDLSCASGSVELNFNGNSPQGLIECCVQKRRGRIISTFTFDKEEEYTENGELYVRKLMKRGGESPCIQLSAASGKVVLK